MSRVRENPLYGVWSTMKQRCNNPNNHKFYRYGARGIRVCNEWMHDFKAFNVWAQASGYEKGLSIDRIKVDGNYEPANCRWVNQKVQQNNRSNNFTISCQGVTKTAAEWAKRSAYSASCIRSRIVRGYSAEDAIFGKDPRPVIITINGESHSMKEWSSITGQKYSLISSRVERGWDPVLAVITPARKGNYRRGHSTIPSEAN